MRTRPIIPAAILTTVLLALALPVGAATRIWLGANSLWSNPDNWSPNGVPQNGDSLAFPVGNPFSEFSMNNDLANLSLDTITFTGAGYTLTGNAITFLQGITDNHSGALNRVNCPVQFTSGGGRFNSLNDGQLEISGTATLANNQDLIVTPLVTNLTISGIIQGNGGLVKRGKGPLFLRGSAANTYTGPTRVEGGRMHLAKTSAARAISADVTIDADFIGIALLVDDLPGQYPSAVSMVITNGGNWFITNGATVTKLFLDDGYLTGSGLLNLECDVTAQGACEIDCSLNLGNQSRTFTINFAGSSEQLEVYGNIISPLGANSSGIIKQGPGLLILKNQNTYQGPTLVKDGYLYVQHGGALGSAGVGGETRLQGGIIRFGGGPFTCPEPMIVESDAAIEFFGTNTLTGPLTLNATCGFWGDFNSDFLEIRSTIDGPGGLPDFWGPGGLQVWSGIVRLSGASPNTFGGGTLVSARGVGWQGVLELAKPDNVMAVPGEVAINASGAPPGNAILRQLQNAGVTNVSIRREGAWLLNGHEVTPTALKFSGAGYVDTQGGVLHLTNPGTNQLQVLSPNPASYPFGYDAGISGRLSCEATTNVFLIESNLTLNVAARVSGGAELVKEGLGTMRLSSSNSFTGPVTINQGTFTAAHPFGLGSTAAGTFVNNNGSLALDGGFNGIEIAGETLTLNSTSAAALTTVGLPVTNTWSGDIVLQRTAGISVPDPGGAFTHFGGVTTFDNAAISGPGGFTKSGSGTMFITGIFGGNSYAGRTTVNEGLLEAARRGSLSSNILVTGANAVLRTGRAGNLFNSILTVLPAGASVTVENGALWAMTPTNSETLSRLQGDGRLDIGSGASLTLSNTVFCTFDGAVSGTGALKKLGLASFRVTGQSPSYTGPATVFDGAYQVDGYFGNSPVTVKVSSVLRGSGAAGDVVVENGGAVKLDPPNPGVLGGAMQFNSANFQAGGVLAAQFYGPHPTAGNDFIYVLNGVTLNNSAHSFGFLYPPREGDVITVVQKIAPGAVSGAFSGFPEGALRTIGQVPVVFSYVGGNGNDVTLTVTNLPLRSGGAPLLTGAGGGALVPNDCSSLTLVVTNRSATTLSNLHGTLRSLTEGVLVTRAESDFSNLAPNARGTNATAFQIRTEPAFPCGGGAQFELVLTGSNIPPIAIPYTLLGASGHALDFDGRNGEVDAAANAFAGVVNNFTIELWANPTGNRTETAETNAGISGVSVPLRQIQRFAVYPDRGNLAYGATHVGAGLSIGRNGISAYEQGTNHLPSRLVYSNALSGWTHVALVYASRRPQLYVNGALVRSSSSASLFANVHPSASLGGSVQADYGNFAGQLDEVRIWNTALSQSQIQSNMTRSLAGNESGLIVYYRCDEGGGSALTDSAPASPNVTGTLASGAAFLFPGVVPFSIPGVDCNSGGGACESCLVVSGTFTTNTPTSTQRLYFSEASVCFPPKPCPGLDPITDLDPDLPPTRNLTHNFTNATTNELCVTAQLNYDCPAAPAGALGVAAYLGGFDPAQPCATYLGDTGFGPPFPAFSFRVPPRTNFVVIVSALLTNLACDSYTLEVFGLPCPPPRLQIARDAAPNKVRLTWSSAYPDYRLQSVNSLDGPGPFPFAVVSNPPALLNGKFSVTNTSTAARQFFRLSK